MSQPAYLCALSSIQWQVVYDESNSEEEVEVEDVFAGGAGDLSDEYEEVEDSEMLDEDDEGSEDDDDDDL
jgi:hypothetical protein